MLTSLYITAFFENLSFFDDLVGWFSNQKKKVNISHLMENAHSYDFEYY